MARSEFRRPLEEFKACARGTLTVVNDKWVVSTVRLPDGLVLSYSENAEARLYWETMVFPVRDGMVDFGDRDCNRYRSEKEARTGHDAMVSKWSLLDAAGKADNVYYPGDLPEG